MHRPKLQVAISVAMTAIILGSAHPSAKAQSPGKPLAKGASVESLLKKRLDVLQQIAKLRRAAYLAGEAGLNSVIQSQIDVLHARLELAGKPAERIVIRTAILKQARDLEAVAKKRFEAKAATPVDMLRAQAFRLRAEADLLREQSAAHQHHHHDRKTSHEAFVRAQTGFLRTLGELDVVQKEIARVKAVAGGAVPGKLILERQRARDKLLAALRAQEEALYLHGLSERQVKSIREKRKLIRHHDHNTAPKRKK